MLAANCVLTVRIHHIDIKCLSKRFARCIRPAEKTPRKKEGCFADVPQNQAIAL
jgi:hypothetical protein